jgi:hypothetical protein
MNNRRNHYRLLQVQPDAPVEIIRASYRTMMRELKLHPDLGGAADLAAAINGAYEVLSDPARRAEYDRRLSLQFTRRGFTPSATVNTPPKTYDCPFCKHKLARRAVPGECCPTCESPLESQEMARLEESSRRCAARMKQDGQILYYTAWPQKGRTARMVDLSPKGMRFTCGEPIKPGTVVKISSPVFEAIATVKNARNEPMSDKSVHFIGVSFLAIIFVNRKGSFFSTCA